MSANPEIFYLHQIKEIYGVDLAKDLVSHPGWRPCVCMQRIHKRDANYTYLEISYLENNIVQATRNTAIISPGNHTEIAYWSEEAPKKSLAVHRGMGYLIIGDPNSRTTEKILIGSGIQQEIYLPSGRFYTIQTEPSAARPLVISGFYQPPINWEGLEFELKPGQNSVQAEGEIRNLPKDFRSSLI